MHVIRARNVNDAYEQGIALIHSRGHTNTSRNGSVKVIDGPVSTEYTNPRERILWEPHRDANPFFHLFESLWMLAGRNDVGYLKFLVPRMADFSDDGTTFHGAYGHRWINSFSQNQIETLVKLLKAKSGTRRAVLQMWDSNRDLNADESGKDLPCNLVATFEIDHTGQLAMTVFNRSNDMILGCYGANAVHFSFLQEYMANRLGVPVGTYHQVSRNFHVYEPMFTEKCLSPGVEHHDRYKDPPFETAVCYPYILHPSKGNDGWMTELAVLLNMGTDPNGCFNTFYEPFFADIGAPLWKTFCLWKAGRREEALKFVDQGLRGVDWIMACKAWMLRRMKVTV
jgi:thymidylate synthase